MSEKKESTQERNNALVEDAKALRNVGKSAGFIVDRLMKKYAISFGTLTNILRAHRTKLDTRI